METTEQTDLELAEKAAGYLGWVLNGLIYVGTGDQIEDEWICAVTSIEFKVFSWPTTGLMIDHLEGLGWVLSCQPSCFDDYVWVEFMASRNISGRILSSKQHSVKNLGYHKAITLAFCEAMQIIGGGQCNE